MINIQEVLRTLQINGLNNTSTFESVSAVLSQLQYSEVDKQEIMSNLQTQGWFGSFPSTPNQLTQGPVIKPYNSKKKYFFVVLILILLAVLIFGGFSGYKYLKNMNTVAPINPITETKDIKDISPIDDSDMRIAINDRLDQCWPIDVSGFATSSNYFPGTSTVDVSKENKDAVIKNNNQIDLFLKGGSWTKAFGATDNEDQLCSLNNYRQMAYLSILKAKILLSEGKKSEAKVVISSLLDVNQNIQNKVENIISYLVTYAVKSTTIDTLEMLVSKKVIQKSEYIPLVSKYNENLVGFKRGLQGEYSTFVKYLLELSSGNFDSPRIKNNFDKEYLDEFVKAKNSFTFQPNNTIKILHDYYKDLYLYAEQGCKTDYIPVITKFDYKKIEDQNYMGKTLVNGSLGMNSLGEKVCSLNKKFNKFLAYENSDDSIGLQGKGTVVTENSNTYNNVSNTVSDMQVPIIDSELSYYKTCSGINCYDIYVSVSNNYSGQQQIIKANSELIINCSGEELFGNKTLVFLGGNTIQDNMFQIKNVLISDRIANCNVKIIAGEKISLPVSLATFQTYEQYLNRVDLSIKGQIAYSRNMAEGYLETNGQSYRGVCSSTINDNSLTRTISNLKLISTTRLICIDDDKSWAISMKLNNGEYWCADYTGLFKKVNSNIIITKCN